MAQPSTGQRPLDASRGLSILSTDYVMNMPEPSSRWVRELAGGSPGLPTAAERAVLEEVLSAIRRVRHGAIEMSIQDGRIVQINTTEKKRL